MITKENLLHYFNLLKQLNKEGAYISFFNEDMEGCVFPSSITFKPYVGFPQKLEKDMDRMLYFLRQTFSNNKKISYSELFLYGESRIRIKVNIGSYEELDKFIKNFLNERIIMKIIRGI